MKKLITFFLLIGTLLLVGCKEKIRTIKLNTDLIDTYFDINITPKEGTKSNEGGGNYYKDLDISVKPRAMYKYYTRYNDEVDSVELQIVINLRPQVKDRFYKPYYFNFETGFSQAALLLNVGNTETIIHNNYDDKELEDYIYAGYEVTDIYGEIVSPIEFEYRFNDLTTNYYEYDSNGNIEINDISLNNNVKEAVLKRFIEWEDTYLDSDLYIYSTSKLINGFGEFITHKDFYMYSDNYLAISDLSNYTDIYVGNETGYTYYEKVENTSGNTRKALSISVLEDISLIDYLPNTKSLRDKLNTMDASKVMFINEPGGYYINGPASEVLNEDLMLILKKYYIEDEKDLNLIDNQNVSLLFMENNDGNNILEIALLFSYFIPNHGYVQHAELLEFNNQTISKIDTSNIVVK